MNITADDIERAIRSAARGRQRRKDVEFVLVYMTQCIFLIRDMLDSGDYRERLEFRELEKVNSNGKRRHILSPTFLTLVLEHLAIGIVEPAYRRLDPGTGLNCKAGCGITATDRRRSVVKRLKHIYYDRRDLHYALQIDQRKCYDHITRRLLRRALKPLVPDRDKADFVVEVSFVGRRFPIGTPTSPLMHHVVMLDFDRWLRGVCPDAVRYADDLFCPFATREQAQRAKWRVKQYWWYAYGMRCKRHTVSVFPIGGARDFCGFVFHRNAAPGRAAHDKGYTGIRRSTADRCRACRDDRSWASYFGQLRHCDAFAMMLQTEKDMDLKRLTEKIRIDRSLDAPNIELRELAESGVEFTIYKYDMRRGSNGEPNWVKCLIGIPETDSETGEPTGRILAREYHGGADALVRFHAACESCYAKDDLLPITGVVVENRCGYIYRGSTNMLHYIN